LVGVFAGFSQAVWHPKRPALRPSVYAAFEYLLIPQLGLFIIIIAATPWFILFPKIIPPPSS
jgi:hypothetical protein